MATYRKLSTRNGFCGRDQNIPFAKHIFLQPICDKTSRTEEGGDG